MPRLLIFAPCEKVLIDQNNNPSLLCVIQGLTSPLPPNVEIPAGALGLMRWDIFTLWQREDGDEDKEFTQDCELIGPHKSVVIQATMPFKFGASTQRNIMSVLGFPLAATGEHMLRLWLRESKQSIAERREIATFPLTVARILSEPVAEK